MDINNPFEMIQMRFDHLEKTIGVLTEMLQDQNTKVAAVSGPADDQQFTIAELAIYLRKSKPTIHNYKKNKVIPYHQAGRTVLFKKSEVDAAMSSMTPKKKGVSR